MGWKTINGRQYLYRSVREGGRVRSEYYGTGMDAALISRMCQIDRERQESRRRVDKLRREEEDRVERALDDLVADAKRAATEFLTAAGYHRHHRGEWRKRRVSPNR
jgi:hypothetical protein